MKYHRKIDFSEQRSAHRKIILEQTIQNLKKRAFDAEYFKDMENAAKAILKMIPKKSSVGIPGSITVREMDLVNKLEKRGNKVWHHWRPELAGKSDRVIRLKENNSDYYLTGANAITTSGEIINIDGVGNRVAGMIYGPDNVIIIAGYNKIVHSVDEGIKRSKDIAATMKAQRISSATPCAKTGVCTDCNAPRRICRVISIIHYRPWQTAITVMLINQQLG